MPFLKAALKLKRYASIFYWGRLAFIDIVSRRTPRQWMSLWGRQPYTDAELSPGDEKSGEYVLGHEFGLCGTENIGEVNEDDAIVRPRLEVGLECLPLVLRNAVMLEIVVTI